jgi:hypothetical protein
MEWNCSDEQRNTADLEQGDFFRPDDPLRTGVN